jgi:hypothetical protein
MATTNAQWDSDPQYDLHVLRGKTSPSLDELLVLVQDDGKRPTAASIRQADRDVDVRFLPELNVPDSGGTWFGHGVTINTVPARCSPTPPCPNRR